MDKRLATLTPNSVCPICFIPFYTAPSRPNTYCSRECYYKATVELSICPQCGKEFLPKTFKKVGYKQTYCSMECYLASKTRYCDYCNKEIPQGQQTKRFCSRTCMGLAYSIDNKGEDNPNWRGGVDCYGSNWKEISKAILARDNYTCQKCNTRGGHLEAHHIIPASFYKNPDIANGEHNLITLCRRCHNGLRQLGQVAIPEMLMLRKAN